MNKQDLRYAYLDYFKNQFANNKPIESKTLFEMAPNGKIAKDVIDELVQEGLVEGIYFVDGKEKSLSLDLHEVVNLTEKGREEINKMISPKKLAEHTEKEEQSSRLSNEDKYHLIIKEILVFFYELSLEPCLLFDDEGNLYTLYKIRGELHKIVEKYFKTSNYHLEYILNKRLYEENLIRYRYGKKYIKDNEEIGIKNFITKEGIKYLEKEYSYCPNKPLSELTEKEYISTYGNIVPRIFSNLSKLAEGPAGLSKALEKQFKLLNNIQKCASLNSNALKLVQQFENFSSLKSAREAAGIYSRITDKMPIIRATEGFQNLFPFSAQKANNTFFQHRNQEDEDINEENKEDNINDKTNKTYTFEGILGQNCGEVEKYIDSSKQLHAKDFVVSRGIRVLRGYAKASNIYKASKAEYDYQRQINELHIDSIKDFLLKMKDSAKYLPEVTLVARNDYKLEKFKLNLKSLSDTQKGIIDNLNYYTLKVKQKSLYRIDGNHRIEAANSIYLEYSKNLYLPFSIILWNPEDYYGDNSKNLKDMIDEERKENEAFLFYFLNSKAKKLEVEENLRGIIKASRMRWSDDDLKIANPNLSLMRLYQEQMQTQIYLNNELCGSNSLKQIAEILTQINENSPNSKIDLEKFQIILQRTNFILNSYKPVKLNDFSFYCKLVFYIAYMNEQNEECIKILENLDNWVTKYKFDKNTFTDPILLYNNATKSNYLKPINIFVAMPFDEENIENFTEWINLSIIKLKEKNIKHSEQLNLNKIMTNRGYAINLIDKIMDEIKECDIFIADISPCLITTDEQEIKCDANPNVMYELGIAHNLKKPIILMRDDTKFPEVPSDIQEKYRNTYKRSNTKKSQQTIQKAIECVLEDFFD